MQYVPPSPPGTLITLHAVISYSDAMSADRTASADAYIGILSNLAAQLGRPVYLCGQWRPGSLANGSGMMVRALRRCDDGAIETIEGLQLSDGRILSGNKIIDRSELHPNY